MTVLISGGAKNGKSDFAQVLAVKLTNGSTYYYVTTLNPFDEEDHRHIQNHLASRENVGYETIECGKNILLCLNAGNKNGAFFLIV